MYFSVKDDFFILISHSSLHLAFLSFLGFTNQCRGCAHFGLSHYYRVCRLRLERPVTSLFKMRLIPSSFYIHVSDFRLNADADHVSFKCSHRLLFRYVLHTIS